MGLRGFFTRSRESETGLTAAAPTNRAEPEASEHLSLEQLAELQDAWAELSEAAQAAGVTSFHACTRDGKSWEDDLDNVRGLAATLRKLGAEGPTAGAPDEAEHVTLSEDGPAGPNVGER